jgi:hypothetical protein
LAHMFFYRGKPRFYRKQNKHPIQMHAASSARETGLETKKKFGTHIYRCSTKRSIMLVLSLDDYFYHGFKILS